MTTYTNEQLTAMTPEQLAVIILQSQVVATIEETVPAQTDATIAEEVIVAEIATETVQTDTEKAIEKVSESIANLKAAGEDLFKTEISTLEEKLFTLQAEAKAEVEEIGTEFVMAEQNFIKKYGQVAAHGVEIILLATIAGKLLGVL